MSAYVETIVNWMIYAKKCLTTEAVYFDLFLKCLHYKQKAMCDMRVKIPKSHEAPNVAIYTCEPVHEKTNNLGFDKI